MSAEELSDDELLRRITPYHEPRMDQNPPSGGAPILRPPSNAFALRPGEAGLSFHIESSLRAAGEPLTYGCPSGEPGWAVARILAGRVRSLGLRVERDGLPYHAQVFGLDDLRGGALRRTLRDLARHSNYIVFPIAV